MRDTSPDPGAAPARLAASSACGALFASRARVAAAAHRHRRLIELELHDGVVQDLVALTVNLQLAQGLLDADPDGARVLLAEMRRDIHTTLETLRALSNDIYPPLLTDLGLAASFAAIGSAVGVAVRVEADALGRYRPEVEAAAYFCCVDALQNVAAHAGPRARATIAAWSEPMALHFGVADDGCGFDPVTTAAGSGLRAMRDGVEAVGGQFAVTSSPGHGTTVAGTIPLAPTTGV